MKTIEGKKQYLNEFEKKNCSLERADRVRDIELDLYWRRATYFWAFNAGAFAGYFALRASSPIPYDSLIIVSCLGLHGKLTMEGIIIIFSIAFLIILIVFGKTTKEIKEKREVKMSIREYKD